ncbi:MAG: hypothetical protein ACLQUT_03250 [Thermoleophilia bacterium]
MAGPLRAAIGRRDWPVQQFSALCIRGDPVTTATPLLAKLIRDAISLAGSGRQAKA